MNPALAFFLIYGAICAVIVWIGQRRKVNRRRKDVLGAPSRACQRNGVEAAP